LLGIKRISINIIGIRDCTYNIVTLALKYKYLACLRIVSTALFLNYVASENYLF